MSLSPSDWIWPAPAVTGYPDHLPQWPCLISIYSRNDGHARSNLMARQKGNRTLLLRLPGGSEGGLEPSCRESTLTQWRREGFSEKAPVAVDLVSGLLLANVWLPDKFGSGVASGVCYTEFPVFRWENESPFPTLDSGVILQLKRALWKHMRERPVWLQSDGSWLFHVYPLLQRARCFLVAGPRDELLGVAKSMVRMQLPPAPGVVLKTTYHQFHVGYSCIIIVAIAQQSKKGSLQ
ncbi:hypothetical protein K431DRAFT_295202 [Polychaeton citri CBS 116435]|uniref:Uncharacterized protein n=1 Tax=Polychaeton citri CBS 116435 TaxID=1314669 RepID=A0A9P4UPT4_9PEZI|nr:hypothetical protein K431DRAFT_295202 [Polychaeton citri CBS 116435]